MLEEPHAYLGYVCGFLYAKLGVSFMKINMNKKLVFRSVLFVLLISAIGGGAYLADQNSHVQEQPEMKLSVENPIESYIQTVYSTYSNEIVSIWDDLSNGKDTDINEVLIKVKEYNTLIENQDIKFNSLNLPIKQQLNTFEKFLVASQEVQNTEQRKVLRRLSWDFVEGHNSVKEGFIKILKENDAEFTVEDDGTILYQFPK